MGDRPPVEIYFRRGPEARREQEVPSVGEPLWIADRGHLYVGDGATPGGIPVSHIPIIDEFEIDEDGVTDLELTAAPDISTLYVYLDGLLMRRGGDKDFTVIDQVVRFNYQLKIGDYAEARYRPGV